jgi:hypothetical protein
MWTLKPTFLQKIQIFYVKVLLMATKTEFALITFSHMCCSNDRNESIVTPMSFSSLTYFQKAFDKVPHRRLIRKVENYGIYTNTIIGWIQDFLTGGYQRVAVNGENSNWKEVTSGKR